MTTEDRSLPKQNQQTSPNGDEIDLIHLFAIIWKRRLTILIITAIVAVFGIISIIGIPVEFTAKTVMVPQSSSKNQDLGGLTGLAAAAGVSLNTPMNQTGDLNPVVYPQIIKSLVFQKELMNHPLTWEKIQGQKSILEYYRDYKKPEFATTLKKYTIGLPGVLSSMLRPKNQNKQQPAATTAPEDGLVHLTGMENGMRGVMSSLLTLTVNPKEGVLTLTAKAPEAMAAAQLAKKGQELLQEQITSIKINKAEQNRKYVETLYKEKRQDFYNAQAALARFRDRNLNLNSALARTEEERLSSEFQVAFAVYNDLARQLEYAKIRVKEDTPVFSVIEPVSVPILKNHAKKGMKLMIWFFAGGILGCCWVLGKTFFKKIVLSVKDVELDEN